MRYMGSKARHADDILDIVLMGRKSNQTYVEPFVGGANSLDKVKGLRLASDTHEYLIAMWQAVSRGWMPPENITELQYNDIKMNKTKYPKELVGFVGFTLSFAGKWFGGWSRDAENSDYSARAYKSAKKQFPKLHGVEFVHCSYDKLNIPPNSIIYCDPPYKDTQQYSNKFDHDAFYSWCRIKISEGHVVYISEYSMPDDFVCVWSKDVSNSLDVDSDGRTGTERLFIHKSQHHKRGTNNLLDFM